MRRNNYVSLGGTVEYVSISTRSKNELWFGVENKDISLSISVALPITVRVGDKVLVRGKLKPLISPFSDEDICIEAKYVENKTNGTKWLVENDRSKSTLGPDAR